MNALSLSHLELQTPGHLTVTSFYPTPGNNDRFIQLFHQALDAIGENGPIDSRPWRLDFLEWPEVQERATLDVGSSEVIVVPEDQGYLDSPFFCRWAEAWPSGPEGRRLVLVSAHPASDTPPRLQQFAEWLRQLASSKGMEFFEIREEPNAVHQPDVTTPDSEWELPAPKRFWGLNE